MTRSAFGAFRCVYRVQFWAFAAGVFLGWLLLLLEQQQQQQEHTEGRSNPWLIRQAVARGFWILLFAGVLVHKQPNASSGSSGRSEQADLCYQCITLSVLGCCLVFFVLLLVRCRMPCAAAAESLFILLLLLHHGSEYLFVAAFHPVDLAYDSFLINNSPVYAAVLLLSLIEQQLKPSIAAAVLRSSNALLLLNLLWIVFVLMLVAAMGFAAALLGLAVRGLGFLTLKENFTHQIRRRKNKGHTLCTRGIYSMCRHPAYAGWFWWAVGKQAEAPLED
ncbi:putative isoprenylcysteine carboxylmethyltransferase [Cyclospora cayetanensis]|uniref:Protein-S-isoprenylcysteine O-methyltransferase n=1 Tax=Cyclospora cayetanensis TaxID=88456 RepID=A0A1D3CSY3_9EIME|nr:putative isoprenylcysteine carboxylmethyltransferase [Cyclospora cayetanensis]